MWGGVRGRCVGRGESPGCVGRGERKGVWGGVRGRVCERKGVCGEG